MTAELESEKPDVYEVEEVVCRQKYDTDMNYRHKYIWQKVVGHVILQIGWLCGIYAAIFHAKWATILWSTVIGVLAAESVALGAHRYYTHKSFKATKTLQVLMIIFHVVSGQNSTFTWARDHKLHHRYSDTDADPHNSTRGFFFSHMGWLMLKKHPLVKQKGKEIDISDLTSDKLVMFQYKYFFYLYVPLAVLIPVGVPIYFWNENFWTSLLVAYFCQYVTNLHFTWTINSFAHMWGYKPYDKRVKAVQSKFSWLCTFGDGWHNFHHVFPWDSRMSEFGSQGGISTALLDLLAYLGLAYDLKVTSPNVIYGHMQRHGDETAEKSLSKVSPELRRSHANKNPIHVISSLRRNM